MDALKFLISNKTATLDQLKSVLKTTSTMTVFRKLKALGYISSYSHRGKYYTLREIARFNQAGLWSYNSVRFSKYGNLIETTKQFIEDSTAGFTAKELGQVLHVEVKQTLFQLFKTNRIHREKVSGVYVYASRESAKRKVQLTMRKNSIELSEELKVAVILFFSMLNEKQRRLYAGLEASKLGHGGDKKISQMLGLDAHTIAKGRKELFGGKIEKERIRKKGGGRKPVEKKLLKSSKR